MTRRDKCDIAGRRAKLLTPKEAALAWGYLAGSLEGMGELDIPKFRDLFGAVRKATIYAKKVPHEGPTIPA